MRGAETGEADEVGPWSRWFDQAELDDSIVHFAIESEGELAGEIFLHDIDAESRTAMVGYRIFDAAQRGQGLGVRALSSLVEWAHEFSDLARLVIIARSDNVASCKLAERCGFRYLGSAREDVDRSVYELALST